ncbi:hypothetical protein BpHYR1_050847 [Brachionus plicatilis]|uniref:Uncharacterized protein n=1 Tax=Brachionus plicatilis TaxID=10195 RepID=A0A3M7PAU2_BRAPC|nr:hypothetical protein BpHYR1_050847 [Brachionus plicatilis]
MRGKKKKFSTPRYIYSERAQNSPHANIKLKNSIFLGDQLLGLVTRPDNCPGQFDHKILKSTLSYPNYDSNKPQQNED